MLHKQRWFYADKSWASHFFEGRRAVTCLPGWTALMRELKQGLQPKPYYFQGLFPRLRCWSPSALAAAWSSLAPLMQIGVANVMGRMHETACCILGWWVQGFKHTPDSSELITMGILVASTSGFCLLIRHCGCSPALRGTVAVNLASCLTQVGFASDWHQIPSSYFLKKNSSILI